MGKEGSYIPIHGYRCVACKCEVEVIRSFKEHYLTPTEDEAPPCTGPDNEHVWAKVIGTANFQLNGSGWFKTDYPKGKR